MAIPRSDTPQSTTMAAQEAAAEHRPVSTGVLSAWNTSQGHTSLQDLVAMKLSTRKEVAYPAHAFGRGGVGTFLATGCGRAGITRLPHGSKAAKGTITARALSAGSATNTAASRPWTTATSCFTADTARVSLSARTWGSSLLNRQLAASQQGSVAAPSVSSSKAWEQVVPHPHDFVTAARSSRIHDVPPHNKWAAMSFYENDPAEIRRHIDITTQLDQLHIDSKLQEHAQAKARRMAWAEHQRHMFRQQRLEVALRYQALGLQLRAPHQALFESPAEGEQEGEQVEGQEQGAEAAATEPAPVPAAIPLPKPTFVKIYDRMGQELRDSLRLKEDMWKRKKSEEKKNKEKSEVHADVANLDYFEEQLQMINRQRQRSQYATDTE